MDMTAQRELARLLATLRREHRGQSGLAPHLVPPDKATAYRIAGMVAEELGWPVLGWKIAAMKEEMQQALRTDSPIYGRVYFVKETPYSAVHATLASPIPEVEYQAKLGRDLPPRDKPYRSEEVTDAVASLHPGLELAECRFIHDAVVPAPARHPGRRRRLRHDRLWSRHRGLAQPGHSGPGGDALVQWPPAPQGHGRRRTRPSDGPAHLARQRTVAHRRRHEGRPDDQHRHADRHAGPQAGRDVSWPTSARSAR